MKRHLARWKAPLAWVGRRFVETTSLADTLRQAVAECRLGAVRCRIRRQHVVRMPILSTTQFDDWLRIEVDDDGIVVRPGHVWRS
jgi:hypothetical protein